MSKNLFWTGKLFLRKIDFWFWSVNWKKGIFIFSTKHVISILFGYCTIMWYLIDLKEYFFHRNQFEALISKTRLSPFLPLLTNAEKRFFNDLHITMLCITEVLPAKLVNLNFEILGFAEKSRRCLKLCLNMSKWWMLTNGFGSRQIHS